MMSFEEEAQKKKREKIEKKEKMIREYLTSRTNMLKQLDKNSLKKKNFMIRMQGRRSSDTQVIEEKYVHFPDLTSSRAIRSREREARYYRIVNEQTSSQNKPPFNMTLNNTFLQTIMQSPNTSPLYSPHRTNKMSNSQSQSPKQSLLKG